MFVLGTEQETSKFFGTYKISVEKSNQLNFTKISDDKNEIENLVIILNSRFYHTMIEVLGTILNIYEKNNQFHFNIIMTKFEQYYDSPHVKFLFKILKDNNINYTIYDERNNNKEIIVSNFIYYGNFIRINDNAINNIYKYCFPYVKQKNYVADNKVYLSRKKTIYQTGEPILGFDKNKYASLPFKDDLRVDNEEILEEYFKNKKYKIVYPEDFDNFEDQINYFYNVKNLVSLSGAGLTNQCLMQPGANVVEISTPLMVMGETELHTLYFCMAWAKDHNYYSIPSLRKSKEIIKRLERSGII